MILEVHEPPGYVPRPVATDPDRALIEKTVKDLPWADITFVVLKHDENNWIEGSGSLAPEDGLSARYMLDSQEFVASQAPESLDEVIALLESYCLQDGHWKRMIAWE